MADPPWVGAGSSRLVESRAGAGTYEEEEWETGALPSCLGEAPALMNSRSGRTPPLPGSEEGASVAVRERGHAGLAALTEAGDGHAGHCWLWQLKGW